MTMRQNMNNRIFFLEKLSIKLYLCSRNFLILMSNRKILVIYTGGTIGMMVDPDSKALKPFEFKNIHQQLPMLHLIEAAFP